MNVRLLALLALCLAGLGLAACGGDDETTSVTGEEGAAATGATGAAGSGTAVESAIENAALGPPLTLDCPDSVPLEKGDSFDCEFSSKDASGTMTMTVDSATDSSAELSYSGKATGGGYKISGSQVKVGK
ncbi:MAG TPA: hypothetical protein VEK39_12910 [Solirubrobacterales bacterium]|nr:hypothetical protein [Solirubrobacterales bacterium]